MGRAVYLSKRNWDQIEELLSPCLSVSSIAKRINRNVELSFATFYMDLLVSSIGGSVEEEAHPFFKPTFVRKAEKTLQTESQLWDNCKLDGSQSTVERYLSDLLFFKFKNARNTSSLTPLHISSCLNRACAQVTWTQTNWGTAPFSDEKRFSLDGLHHVYQYWRDFGPGESFYFC